MHAQAARNADEAEARQESDVGHVESNREVEEAKGDAELEDEEDSLEEERGEFRRIDTSDAEGGDAKCFGDGRLKRRSEQRTKTKKTHRRRSRDVLNRPGKENNCLVLFPPHLERRRKN